MKRILIGLALAAVLGTSGCQVSWAGGARRIPHAALNEGDTTPTTVDVPDTTVPVPTTEATATTTLPHPTGDVQHIGTCVPAVSLPGYFRYTPGVWVRTRWDDANGYSTTYFLTTAGESVEWTPPAGTIVPPEPAIGYAGLNWYDDAQAFISNACT